jgi:hypothetical protein
LIWGVNADEDFVGGLPGRVKNILAVVGNSDLDWRGLAEEGMIGWSLTF